MSRIVALSLTYAALSGAAGLGCLVKKLNLYRYARVQDKPPYELDSRQYSVSLNHARNTSKIGRH